MDDLDVLARRFEEHRPRLRAVARRLLGSTAEADDAVQEAWLRLNRSGANEIENLEAWLVRTVGRVALNLLRSRLTRREEPLDLFFPHEVTEEPAGQDPEQEAMLADSLGLALQVVLDTLTPAERLAYVLHDLFSVPFDETGAILDRTPDAARQLASRGRRRIRGLDLGTDGVLHDGPAQRHVVEAFLAAARDGDFDALLAVLDPDIVQRTAAADGSILEVHGAISVAARAQAFSSEGLEVLPALVDGRTGWVTYRNGDVDTVVALTIISGRITQMDVVIDPVRIAHVTVAPLEQ